MAEYEMPKMTLDERRKYLKRVWPRYAQADRRRRNALLTEIEAVTGMHRKSLTRLMRSAHRGSLERKKPRSVVHPALLPTVKKSSRW